MYQYGSFSLNAKSDPEGAKKLFSEALAIFRRLPGDQRIGIATTLSALSDAAQWSGNFANAEQLLRDSMNLLGATVGRNHPDYAASMAGLGYVLLKGTSTMDLELTFAVLVVLTVIGIVINYVVELSEWLMAPWQRVQTN